MTALTEHTIHCPYCTHTWKLESIASAYMRDSLLAMAPAAAAHMRDVHADEEAAIRFERWAVTPTPYRRVSPSE